MPVFETFSKRLLKHLKNGQVDVYKYDEVPVALRNQVIHIINDVIGERDNFGIRLLDIEINNKWKAIHDLTARERGLMCLGSQFEDDYKDRCIQHLQRESTYGALDMIEIAFSLLPSLSTGKMKPAVIELNARFREHSIGYQLEKGEIVRVDSQYVHSEAVVPTLKLLNDKNFNGPEEEFRKAHQLYRSGNNKDAIANALKAFESTMKAICDARSWAYDPAKSTAKELITILFDNALMPAYLTSHFSALRTTLEAGLPTARNKTSGHGQGAATVEVPDYLAAYALHLAASNIVLLVEAHKAQS